LLISDACVERDEHREAVPFGACQRLLIAAIFPSQIPSGRDVDTFWK
jgi:hypothetical protein